MNSFRMIFSLTLAATLTCASLGTSVRAEELGTIFGNDQSVGTSVLAAQRGGTEQSIIATQIANVTGNTVGDFSITGNVSLGSISNAQGMFSVLQNTGNNVAMQSQLVINVNLQ